MTNNWDKTSFILDGDYDEPGDEPEEGSYRDEIDGKIVRASLPTNKKDVVILEV